jgi:hypothetical protein
MTIIVRCNLTVFFEEGMKDLPEYLAKQRIQIVASLPCYTVENVEKQRYISLIISIITTHPTEEKEFLVTVLKR